MSKDNSGSLSRNTKKEKDTHPDYKGKLSIDGKLYWLSGWMKENESGKWISLSAKLADSGQKPFSKPQEVPAAKHDDPFGDEVPF